MGTYIMKVSPDRDLYVEWSSSSGDWVLAGTREEFLAYLTKENKRLYPGLVPLPSQEPEAVMRRCDETGTSVRFRFLRGRRTGDWSDPIQLAARGMLDRDKLGAYVDAAYVGDEDAVTALIRPFED